MSTPQAKAERRTKFEGVFAKIRDELVADFAGEGMPEEAVDWYRNVSSVCLGFLKTYILKDRIES